MTNEHRRFVILRRLWKMPMVEVMPHGLGGNTKGLTFMLMIKIG
jgi:hypothetical protein